ncbi:hypothetical protein EON67_05175 [archaeon]|nr:MAG: hypothetical protein EON67_05175 [archaeon]
MSTVMHPIFPIFDPHSSMGGTHAFEAACRRMFHVIDRDHNNLLSTDELALQQTFTNGVRVTEQEMLNVLQVRCAMRPSARLPRSHATRTRPSCPHTRTH